MILLRIVVVITILIIEIGCVSTLRFNSNLTKNEISSNNAVIKVSRSRSWGGGAVAAGIADGTTKIGELGPGGELIWSRPAGYIALIASRFGYSPTHVIIFPVESGKTYSLHTSISWGGRFNVVPDDFSKDIIVYEEEAKSSDDEITGQWKMELNKLKGQAVGSPINRALNIIERGKGDIHDK